MVSMILIIMLFKVVGVAGYAASVVYGSVAVAIASLVVVRPLVSPSQQEHSDNLPNPYKSNLVRLSPRRQRLNRNLLQLHKTQHQNLKNRRRNLKNRPRNLKNRPRNLKNRSQNLKNQLQKKRLHKHQLRKNHQQLKSQRVNEELKKGHLLIEILCSTIN